MKERIENPKEKPPASPEQHGAAMEMHKQIYGDGSTQAAAKQQSELYREQMQEVNKTLQQMETAGVNLSADEKARQLGSTVKPELAASLDRGKTLVSSDKDPSSFTRQEREDAANYKMFKSWVSETDNNGQVANKVDTYISEKASRVSESGDKSQILPPLIVAESKTTQPGRGPTDQAIIDKKLQAADQNPVQKPVDKPIEKPNERHPTDKVTQAHDGGKPPQSAQDQGLKTGKAETGTTEKVSGAARQDVQRNDNPAANQPQRMEQPGAGIKAETQRPEQQAGRLDPQRAEQQQPQQRFDQQRAEQQPPRIEPQRVEPQRLETQRPETQRPEAARPEPVRPETPRIDPQRTEQKAQPAENARSERQLQQPGGSSAESARTERQFTAGRADQPARPDQQVAARADAPRQERTPGQERTAPGEQSVARTTGLPGREQSQAGEAAARSGQAREAAGLPFDAGRRTTVPGEATKPAAGEKPIAADFKPLSSDRSVPIDRQGMPLSAQRPVLPAERAISPAERSVQPADRSGSIIDRSAQLTDRTQSQAERADKTNIARTERDAAGRQNQQDATPFRATVRVPLPAERGGRPADNVAAATGRIADTGRAVEPGRITDGTAGRGAALEVTLTGRMTQPGKGDGTAHPVREPINFTSTNRMGDRRYLIGTEIALAAVLVSAGIARIRTDASKAPSDAQPQAKAAPKPESELKGERPPLQPNELLLQQEGMLPEKQTAKPEQLQVGGDPHIVRFAGDTEKVEEPSEEKAADQPQEDDTLSNRPKVILQRPTTIVELGDTLVSLGEAYFQDPNLGWLIADLNAATTKQHWMGAKRVVEMRVRQVITLPVWEDINEFYANRPKEAVPENLVTIVEDTQVNSELLDLTLGKVTGTSGHPSGKPVLSQPRANQTREPDYIDFGPPPSPVATFRAMAAKAPVAIAELLNRRKWPRPPATLASIPVKRVLG